MPRKRADHRNPKLLLTTPPIPGECRFCKKPIVGKFGERLLRKTWHPRCVKEYEIHQNPRMACFLRDGGVCAKCGNQETSQYGNWQADHIIPLKLGGSFELQNVQTLCNSCHFEKSRLDCHQIRNLRKSGGIP